MKLFSRNSQHGSVVSLAAYGASAVALLGLLPIMVRELGGTAYGAWVLTGGLVNLIAVFDFGFYLAVSRFVAMYRWQTPSMAKESITVAAVFLFLVGIAAMGLALAVAEPWGEHLRVPQATTATVLAGPATLMVLMSKVFQGSLDGSGRVALTRVLQAVSSIVFAVGAVVVVSTTSPSLTALSLFLCAHSTATLVVYGTLALWDWGWELPFRRPGRRVALSVLRYSLGVWSSSMIGTLVEPLSRILVGTVSGPTAVAPLDIALRVRAGWFGGAVAFVSPLLPRFGAEGQSAHRAAFTATIAFRRFGLVATAATGLVAPMMLVGFPGVFGSQIGREVALLSAAAIIVWTPAIVSLVPYSYLVYYGRARDLVDIQVTASGIGLTLAVPLLWLIGVWAPILSLGLGTLVAYGVVIRRARQRAGDRQVFSVGRVRSPAAVRAGATTLLCVGMLMLPGPLIILVPLACGMWTLALQSNIRLAIRAI